MAATDVATKQDLADLRVDFKRELERFATKDDLERFATKKDLDRFATKEDLRAMGVMLERLDGTVRLLAEGLVATREQLERRIDEQGERLSARITLLEEAVREHGRAMHRYGEDVAKLRHDFVHRTRLESLEYRLAVLEERAGLASQ